MICWLSTKYSHSPSLLCIRTNVRQFIHTLIQLSIYTLAIVVLGPISNVIFLSYQKRGAFDFHKKCLVWASIDSCLSCMKKYYL